MECGFLVVEVPCVAVEMPYMAVKLPELTAEVPYMAPKILVFKARGLQAPQKIPSILIPVI